MQITKRSVLTGAVNTMEIPATKKQIDAWQASGDYIQNALPHLTADQREFLLTGATPKEWNDAFGEDDDGAVDHDGAAF